MEWLGINQVPFTIVFTKTDKLRPEELKTNLKNYEEKMFETWETMPGYYVSSAESGEGTEEILDFIEHLNSEK
jgi:GTP-binding protein